MNRITAPPGEGLPDTLAVVSRTPGSTGGHDFATLITEVAAESNFKPGAINKLTGASGPFQFVKSTWLSLLHDYGAAAGVKAELLQQITVDAKGHMKVATPAALGDLLALRNDPILASKMAAKYLDEGRAALRHNLKREPTEAEIHIAYLLGPTGATHLINAARQAPSTPVDRVIGSAATSNRTLFFDKGGDARTAAQAVSYLTGKYLSDKTRVASYSREIVSAPKAKIDA